MTLKSGSANLPRQKMFLLELLQYDKRSFLPSSKMIKLTVIKQRTISWTQRLELDRLFRKLGCRRGRRGPKIERPKSVNETCLSGQSLYPRGSADQIPRQTRRPPAPLHQPEIELLNWPNWSSWRGLRHPCHTLRCSPVYLAKSSSKF